MTPSLLLKERRTDIRRLVAIHRAVNPRVFGSVAKGADTESSDLDLLVDPLPGTTLFDLGGLQVELEELLGVRVDVRTPADLPPSFRDAVLAEALPI